MNNPYETLGVKRTSNVSIIRNKYIQLAKKYNSIECVNNMDGISSYIKDAQIFVGSAGTAVFETALFKTPTILISMAQNQETNIYDSVLVFLRYIYF